MNKFKDLGIERAVLGTVMLNGEPNSFQLNKMFEMIGENVEVFTSPNHRTIYKAIKSLASAGKVVDITTIGHELQNKKELDKVGGRLYIVQMATEEYISSAGFESYLSNLMNMFQGRELFNVVKMGESCLQDPDINFEDVLESMQNQFFKLSERSKLDRSFSMKETIQQVMKEIDHLAAGDLHSAGFIKTEFKNLDKRLLGFKRGDFIVIGGLRGEGKTQLAIQMAFEQACAGIPVDIESIEMGKEALVQRLMQYKSGVSSSKVVPNLDEDSYNRLVDAGKFMEDIPLIITDDPSTTPERMMSRVRRLVVEKNVAIVYVDYLQLMQTNVKDGNREREVSHAAQMCKLIARECNVVVVALSQLTEIEDGKKPTLSCLRESKAIGHHADIVLFPYHKKKEKESYLTIGKNRNRDIGSDVQMNYLWHNNGWWTEIDDFGSGSEYNETFNEEQEDERSIQHRNNRHSGSTDGPSEPDMLGG